MRLSHNWIPVLLAAGFLLAGCEEKKPDQAANSASDGESASIDAQDTHAAWDGAGSKESAGNENEEAKTQAIAAPIEEARSIPADEKKAILAVLDKQIASFNAKNIDAYMSTISKTPTSFDYEEEKAYVEKVFNTLDASMTASHATIIKYEEKTKTANVFMNIKSTSKDKSTGKAVSQTTRQIMVFQKEEEGWKQVSLFAME